MAEAMTKETQVGCDVAFVADGRERSISANRSFVEAEVRPRYAEQLAAAGTVERLRLEWQIRREVRQAIERIAPDVALY